MLDIYAGENALKTIQEHGFKQELFTKMLGASGGPKWFTLFALDKYLFGDFFKGRSDELNIIGSSAGAFRFAALGQADPVAAITRLATHYSETVYSKNAKPDEITDKAKQLLDQVYAEKGVEELLNNEVVKAHFIVAKCHGLTAYESPLLQILGLSTSMVLNRINRKLIASQYQRFVFHHPKSQLKVLDRYAFNDTYISLDQTNLKDALLASGSIPLVMQAVKDINNAPKGTYRDGGIIDYHFDINLSPTDGLTLYPHFNSQPKAGWFDKSSNRSVDINNYKSVVMLSPSAEFIAALPYGKIPDRTDFTEMEPAMRISYWKTVLNETERLAQSLEQLISDQNISQIKPITEIIN
jgi:hypothetical protein